MIKWIKTHSLLGITIVISLFIFTYIPLSFSSTSMKMNSGVEEDTVYAPSSASHSGDSKGEFDDYDVPYWGEGQVADCPGTVNHPNAGYSTISYIEPRYYMYGGNLSLKFDQITFDANEGAFNSYLGNAAYIDVASKPTKASEYSEVYREQVWRNTTGNGSIRDATFKQVLLNNQAVASTDITQRWFQIDTEIFESPGGGNDCGYQFASFQIQPHHITNMYLEVNSSNQIVVTTDVDVSYSDATGNHFDVDGYSDNLEEYADYRSTANDTWGEGQIVDFNTSYMGLYLNYRVRDVTTSGYITLPQNYVIASTTGTNSLTWTVAENHLYYAEATFSIDGYTIPNNIPWRQSNTVVTDFNKPENGTDVIDGDAVNVVDIKTSRPNGSDIANISWVWNFSANQMPQSEVYLKYLIDTSGGLANQLTNEQSALVDWNNVTLKPGIEKQDMSGQLANVGQSITMQTDGLSTIDAESSKSTGYIHSSIYQVSPYVKSLYDGTNNCNGYNCIIETYYGNWDSFETSEPFGIDPYQMQLDQTHTLQFSVDWNYIRKPQMNGTDSYLYITIYDETKQAYVPGFEAGPNGELTDTNIYSEKDVNPSATTDNPIPMEYGANTVTINSPYINDGHIYTVTFRSTKDVVNFNGKTLTNISTQVDWTNLGTIDTSYSHEYDRKPVISPISATIPFTSYAPYLPLTGAPNEEFLVDSYTYRLTDLSTNTIVIDPVLIEMGEMQFHEEFPYMDDLIPGHYYKIEYTEKDELNDSDLNWEEPYGGSVTFQTSPGFTGSLDGVWTGPEVIEGSVTTTDASFRYEWGNTSTWTPTRDMINSNDEYSLVYKVNNKNSESILYQGQFLLSQEAYDTGYSTFRLSELPGYDKNKMKPLTEYDIYLGYYDKTTQRYYWGPSTTFMTTDIDYNQYLDILQIESGTSNIKVTYDYSYPITLPTDLRYEIYYLGDFPGKIENDTEVYPVISGTFTAAQSGIGTFTTNEGLLQAGTDYTLYISANSGDFEYNDPNMDFRTKTDGESIPDPDDSLEITGVTPYKDYAEVFFKWNEKEPVTLIWQVFEYGDEVKSENVVDAGSMQLYNQTSSSIITNPGKLKTNTTYIIYLTVDGIVDSSDQNTTFTTPIDTVDSEGEVKTDTSSIDYWWIILVVAILSLIAVLVIV